MSNRVAPPSRGGPHLGRTGEDPVARIASIGPAAVESHLHGRVSRVVYSGASAPPWRQATRALPPTERKGHDLDLAGPWSLPVSDSRSHGGAGAPGYPCEVERGLELPFAPVALIASTMTTALTEAQTTTQPAPAPRAGGGGGDHASREPSPSNTGAQTTDTSSGDPYADCVDKDTCSLTIARARTVASVFVRHVAQGSPYGITDCTQQSPWEVSCDVWINARTPGIPGGCHYTASVDIIQPTYQRALLFRNGPAGTC
jgi:hypothetical protein